MTPRRLDIVLVNLLTLTGCVAGLLGVYQLPSPAAIFYLGLSVAIDAIDGAIARRLNAATALGARFDWCVDTCLSYAIAYQFLPDHPIVSAVLAGSLIATQSFALWSGRRFSGRTIVTAIAISHLIAIAPTYRTPMHTPDCTCAECTSARLTGGLTSPAPSTGQLVEALLTEQYQGNGDTPLAAPQLGIGAIVATAATLPVSLPTPGARCTLESNLMTIGPGRTALLRTPPALADCTIVDFAVLPLHSTRMGQIFVGDLLFTDPEPPTPLTLMRGQSLTIAVTNTGKDSISAELTASVRWNNPDQPITIVR